MVDQEISNGFEKNDLELQKQEILQKTGKNNPKESKLDSKNFLPICCSAEEYDLNR